MTMQDKSSSAPSAIKALSGAKTQTHFNLAKDIIRAAEEIIADPEAPSFTDLDQNSIVGNLAGEAVETARKVAAERNITPFYHEETYLLADMRVEWIERVAPILAGLDLGSSNEITFKTLLSPCGSVIIRGCSDNEEAGFALGLATKSKVAQDNSIFTGKNTTVGMLCDLLFESTSKLPDSYLEWGIALEQIAEQAGNNAKIKAYAKAYAGLIAQTSLLDLMIEAQREPLGAEFSPANPIIEQLISMLSSLSIALDYLIVQSLSVFVLSGRTGLDEDNRKTVEELINVALDGLSGNCPDGYTPVEVVTSEGWDMLAHLNMQDGGHSKAQEVSDEAIAKALRESGDLH